MVATTSPQRFRSSLQLATVIQRCVNAAMQSTDLATIDAAHTILDHEHALGIEGLGRMIQQDPAGFFLVAAPGFSKELHRVTGFTREWWVARLPLPNQKRP